MDAWTVLRHIHKVGSPICGVVTARDAPDMLRGHREGRLIMAVGQPYSAILPYRHLMDEAENVSPEFVPEIGDQVDAVVFNFVDGVLYLSARPHDLNEQTVRGYQQYYEYIDTLAVGTQIMGTVKQSAQFGIFVDVGGPYRGLIDIGHTQFNGGVSLPLNRLHWPQVGDRIKCRITYFRFHNQQLGLGWSP